MMKKNRLKANGASQGNDRVGPPPNPHCQVTVKSLSSHHSISKEGEGRLVISSANYFLLTGDDAEILE